MNKTHGISKKEIIEKLISGHTMVRLVSKNGSNLPNLFRNSAEQFDWVTLYFTNKLYTYKIEAKLARPKYFNLYGGCITKLWIARYPAKLQHVTASNVIWVLNYDRGFDVGYGLSTITCGTVANIVYTLEKEVSTALGVPMYSELEYYLRAEGNS